MKEKVGKRKQIINAAMEIFSKKGYERGTISEIAKLANIAKGTFYQYFDSKEAIIYELFDMFFEKFMLSWRNIIKKDLDPKTKIRLLIDQTFDDLIQMQEEENLTTMVLIFEIMFFLFRKSLKDKNREKNEIEQFFSEYYNILVPIFEEGRQVGLFRQDIDPAYAAYLIFGMIDGFSLHFIIQKDNYDTDKSKEYLTNLILNGLVKK